MSSCLEPIEGGGEGEAGGGGYSPSQPGQVCGKAGNNTDTVRNANGRELMFSWNLCVLLLIVILSYCVYDIRKRLSCSQKEKETSITKIREDVIRDIEAFIPDIINSIRIDDKIRNIVELELKNILNSREFEQKLKALISVNPTISEEPIASKDARPVVPIQEVTSSVEIGQAVLCDTKQNEGEASSILFAKIHKDGIMIPCVEDRANYKITQLSATEGEFEYCGSFQEAKDNSNAAFDNYADVEGVINSSSGVVTVSKGIVEQTDGGKWKVTKKAIVRFL